MEYTWLNGNLIEVRGARTQEEAIWFVEQETGRIVDRCVYIAANVFQVALR